MTVGDITATVVEYPTMALLIAAYDLLNTGATTAGGDITTFNIIVNGTNTIFYLVKVVRAQA